MMREEKKEGRKKDIYRVFHDIRA
jgi:hypothetical protein